MRLYCVLFLRELRGLAGTECNDVFLNFIQQWVLYGSTVFEVTQSYTLTLPKNLWLAVNQDGVHILKRRDKVNNNNNNNDSYKLGVLLLSLLGVFSVLRLQEYC